MMLFKTNIKIFRKSFLRKKIIILILILLLILLESCANIIPWKTKFYIGKWILPVQNTYYTLEFFKDGTFKTRGRKFCNIGNYILMNHQKNSAIIKLNSASNLFNTTLLVLRYKEGLYIKWASYSQLWYSVKSEKGIRIIELVSKNLKDLYEIETWDHYYLMNFAALNKSEKDLLIELEEPDNINDLGNQKIYFYKNKGEDEYGNIYNYKFYILSDKVIKVESEISIRSIINN